MDGSIAVSTHTTAKAIGWTKTASKSLSTILTVSTKRFTLQTFISRRECSVPIAILARTIMATEKFMVSRELPPVQRLQEFEAVRLFADRAALAQSSFTVTQANAAAVVKVC